MSRIIKITEEQERKLIGMMLNETKVYPVDPNKVLIVKKFLDKHFVRSKYTHTDSTGDVVNQTVVMPKDPSGKPFGDKPISLRTVFLRLEEEYKEMFEDKVQRTKFLQQVIKDWLGDRISGQGLLSVNLY